jgi:hypothetical protein
VLADTGFSNESKKPGRLYYIFSVVLTVLYQEWQNFCIFRFAGLWRFKIRKIPGQTDYW